MKIGQEQVYNTLEKLQIEFDYMEHPALNTIEEAVKYKSGIDAGFCKNLFFRNHKGKKHYLVVFEHKYQLNIKDLEQRLKQGKLSFASEKRMDKYLGLKAGSVSPFGLINDIENHVHVFLDANLKKLDKWSFHPNHNEATLILRQEDMMKYLDSIGNTYEFIELY